MQFTRKKLITGLAAVITATTMTAYTFAAPDYDRIKKDINIMIGIVKSSLQDNKDCRRCGVKISGHYLADQGVVFNVNASGGFSYNFKTFSDIEVPEAPSVIAINGLVEEIMEDVEISFGSGDGHSWEFHTEDFLSENREVQRELREARREMRELSREIRELELEAIHAEADELKRLEEREQELKAEFATAEAEHDRISERLNRYAEERTKEREAKRAEKLAARQQQFKQMEDIVLASFCDYSSTIRNLPKGEKVSIIFSKGDDESNVYVFEQAKLENCDSRKADVRQHALTYAF